MSEHKGMTIAGNGASELGKLMREQRDSRAAVYPDGNPNATLSQAMQPQAKKAKCQATQRSDGVWQCYRTEWECGRCERNEPAAGEQAGAVAIINEEPAAAHSLLAALIDIYDDAQSAPPESRCYVESAWPDVLKEARTFLAAPGAAIAAREQEGSRLADVIKDLTHICRHGDDGSALIARHALGTLQGAPLPSTSHDEAPATPAGEAVLWQWRRKGDPWTLEKTFTHPVVATTADSEVRVLYTQPTTVQQAETILRELLAHDFAEDCQECAIGKSNAWTKAKEFLDGTQS